jgi:serine/threonine-protein kinase RsbW
MPPINLSVHRTMEGLDNFRKNFADLLAKNKVPPDIIWQVELCLYEVIINIIEHDNAEHSSLIEVHSEVKKDLFCTITYNADFFDLTKQTLPNTAEHFASGKKGGLGIYIIHTLMDNLEYTHENGIATLKMMKKIS